VRFVEYQARQAYLETYRGIDVALDTFPYNGHTTSLDALWMGVPVVTLVGPTVVGRAGLSQAQNLGLPELVATDEDRFVEIAAGLSADLERLASLRGELRGRMERSPLMDAARFARNLEAAFVGACAKR
jgi:protein O-GlcNAc transferase